MPKTKSRSSYPWYVFFLGGLLIFSAGTVIGYTTGSSDTSSSMFSGTESSVNNSVDEYSVKLGTFNPDQGEELPNPTGVITQYGDENAVPPPPPRNCTLTIGFWKNHAGFGPQEDVLTPNLPIWLGMVNGDKSVQVTTAEQAVSILNKNDDASNGINKLYAQLLGSKLNIASGAVNQEITDYLNESDSILARYNELDWQDLNSELQQKIISLADKFDSFNNGEIGPAHCG